MLKYDILALGNAIVDILLRVDDSAINRLGVAKGGMTLIDADMAHRLYEELTPELEMSGGSAANTIVGAAGDGARTAFIGKVHDDALGEIFTREINGAGVDFNTEPDKHGPKTARCFVFITPDAERTMCTYLGASVELGPEDIDRQKIEQSRLTYVEGYLWDDPRAKAAIKETAACARAAGRQLAFTLSDAFCVERHRAEFLELIRSDVDLLFANEAELTALYETPSLEAALSMAGSMVQVAAVTRGARGCLVANGTTTYAVPASPVAKVVDTTGAGDMFAAGFLAAYCRDESLEDCARAGVEKAGRVIQHVGAREVALT